MRAGLCVVLLRVGSPLDDLDQNRNLKIWRNGENKLVQYGANLINDFTLVRDVVVLNSDVQRHPGLMGVRQVSYLLSSISLSFYDSFVKC